MAGDFARWAEEELRAAGADVCRTSDRNPLDEPSRTGRQLTDYLGTARTKGQPEHPMARADYRVDAD